MVKYHRFTHVHEFFFVNSTSPFLTSGTHVTIFLFVSPHKVLNHKVYKCISLQRPKNIAHCKHITLHIQQFWLPNVLLFRIYFYCKFSFFFLCNWFTSWFYQSRTYSKTVKQFHGHHINHALLVSCHIPALNVFQDGQGC